MNALYESALKHSSSEHFDGSILMKGEIDFIQDTYICIYS